MEEMHKVKDGERAQSSHVLFELATPLRSPRAVFTSSEAFQTLSFGVFREASFFKHD